MKRWKHRPEGSTWGDWGDDDQLGRLNLITPKKVLEGVAEVKEGLSFCLSLPLDLPGGNVLNPRRLPPVLSPTGDENGWRFNFHTNTINPLFMDVASDDRVILTLQYSTQWDTLAHVGGMFDADGDGVPEPLYYNGFKAGSDVVGPQPDAGRDGCGHMSYAHKLGVENMAAKAIQGRAVMVDLEKHYGRDHKYVNYDDFRRVLEADKVVVEPGDMLLLHTGFTDEITKMNKKVDPMRAHAMCSVLDGRDKRLLQWITDSQISALIADNYGVEAVPARPGPADTEHPSLPIHNHCLFKLGLNLGEIWWLKDLALWLRDNKRSRFLLTAPPLRLPGAVGSPATPVATV
jgi:kynurenine formamidase